MFQIAAPTGARISRLVRDVPIADALPIVYISTVALSAPSSAHPDGHFRRRAR